MEQSGRPNLNHIQTFVGVARTGSFTRAAQSLAMPRSTVSQHLRALEERLGARLLQRTTRRVSLTEAGRLFLSHCERVVSEAEDAARAVTHYRAEPRGLLRIGVPVTFARSFLAPMLTSFCLKYPELRIELVIPGKLDPVENRLDLVIRVGRVEDSSYIVRKLVEIPRALFASRRYLKERGVPESPPDLSQHSLIATSRDPQGTRWRLSQARPAKATEIAFEPRMAVADPVVAHQIATAGGGIAILPVFLNNERPPLVRVLPAWSPPPVEVFALYPARELTPPKLRVFLEELQESLARLPGV